MKNKNIWYFSLLLLCFLSLAFVVLVFSKGSNTFSILKKNRSGEVVFNNNKQEINDPADVVESFYSWYISSEENMLTTGAYKTSDLLTEGLKNRVDSILSSIDKESFDPFICAQNKATSFWVNSAEISGNEARVDLEADWDQVKQIIPIKLNLLHGKWLISDVVCADANQKEAVDMEIRKIVVYYQNPRRMFKEVNDCGIVYGLERNVKISNDEYKQLLDELVMGPSKSEQNLGYESMFSNKTKDLIKSVKIIKDIAYVNFNPELTKLIPNLSASCMSQNFLASINETMKHERNITKVIMGIDGSSEEFYEIVQLGCSKENNFCDNSGF